MKTLATILVAIVLACDAAQAVDPTNCLSRPDGLVAWWRAESNGVDSVGGYHATVGSAVTFAPGRKGQAFQFRGNNLHGGEPVIFAVMIPPAPALSPHADTTGESGLAPHPQSIGEMTLQAWVKIPRLPTIPSADHIGRFVVHKFSGDFGREYSLFIKTNGMATFEVSRFGGEGFRASGGFVSPNEWHHLIGTFKKNTFVRLYLDGVLIHELSNPLFPGSVTFADLIIGQQGAFDGLIDDVALFRRALTASEILALYDAGSADLCLTCVTPPVGRVSWWTGDETARDLVGFADGMVQGTATYAPGRVGPAFSLDGTNGFVLIPHHRSLDARTNYYAIAADPPASFTYEAWIQTTNATGSMAILGKIDCGHQCFAGEFYAIQLRLEDGRPLALVRDNDAGGPAEMEDGQILTSSQFLADGQFHHLALVRDIGLQQLRLYVDGVLATNAPLQAGASGPLWAPYGEDPLLLGAQEQYPSGYVRHFRGLIDEVTWSNRALTTAEVQAIHGAAGAGQCRPARLNFSTLGRGGVTVSPGASRHFAGDLVTLTATNARYHRFLAWSDGTTNNPRLVTLGLSNDFRAIFTNTVPLEERVFQLWDHSYGGVADDAANSAVVSSDGGFYMAGRSASGVSGNKTSPTAGSNDFWFLRLNPDGDVITDESYGGTNSDTAYVVRPVTQFGWILGGSSSAGGGGNKSDPGFGSSDFWIKFRLYDGQRNGDVSLGGTESDQLNSLEETADEGFIMAGSSTSGVTAGNVNAKTTPSLGGGQDFWVVRGSFFGTKIWERTLGGSGNDVATSVRQTRDGGFIVGGTSSSGADGNRTAPNLGGNERDFWVVRLDAFGNTLWDRAYGTTNWDVLSVVLQTADGGYALGDTQCDRDMIFLIIRLDADGNELWRTTPGGDGPDVLRDLREMPDGGFLAGGYSVNSTGGSKTAPNRGRIDSWIVRFGASGDQRWDASFGGTNSDLLVSLALTPDGALLAGYSNSDASGTKTAPNHGGTDFWAVKVAFREAPVGTPVVLVDGRYSPSNSVTVTNLAVIDLQSSFPGAHIFFTLDGTPPENGFAFAGPFAVAEGAIVRAVAFAADFALAAEADPVRVNVHGPPVFLRQPEGQRVAIGANVNFEVAVAGDEPLNFQWLFDGGPLAGANAQMLARANVQAADAGDFAVVVSNAFGVVTSAVARLTVLAPAEITSQPMNASVPPGANVSFCVSATGSEPIRYQWRLNGLNIPGATNSCFSITNVQVTNGGSYTVIVANDAGAVTSDPAVLSVQVAEQQPADNFAERVALAPGGGLVSGTNTAATRELDEWLHADKPGGKSVWYRWRPEASGIATFDTRGSGFDTLLAIYTGGTVSALSPVASDEDSGGYLTSLVRYNVTAGTDYAVAIDGFGGASGRFVLRWDLESTLEIIPALTTQPRSIAAQLGGTATFAVAATASQAGITYQWLFDGAVLANATNSSFTPTNVQLADVGIYAVRVSHTNNPGRVALSASASLELGPEAGVVSYDKLEDLLNAPAGGGDGLALAGITAPAGGFISVNLGGFDGQSLVNTNSGTQAGETNHCNLLANGTTRYFGIRALTNGLLVVDTVGSDFNTLLAVYRWSGVSVRDLPSHLVACDSDTNLGSRISFTVPPLAPRTNFDYLVAVDTIGGPLANSPHPTNPVIRLNWRLGVPPVITSQSPDQFLTQGSDVPLAVTASNLVAPGVTNRIGPPEYRWSFEGTPLPGATNAVLALASAQLADGGRYTVAVRNEIGSTSTVIRVAVLQSNFTSRVVTAGGSTTLGITLAGDAACIPGYQWLRDGARLLDRTGPTLALTGIGLPDAGRYSVTVTNCFGAITIMVSTVSVEGRFRLNLGSHADLGEFRLPPTSEPVCGLVLECAPELSAVGGPWQPIQTNLNLQGVFSLPPDAGPNARRFYRLRLLPCPR